MAAIVNRTMGKVLKIRTPEKIMVMALNIEQCDFKYRRLVRPKDAYGMANNVDPDHVCSVSRLWLGKADFCFLFTFFLVLARISDDRTYKEYFNEQFYKLDVSIFLIRGSDRALAFFDVVELWSTSALDSPQQRFVPGTCQHYLFRNKTFFSSYY